jgi:hypothetical protein
VEAGSERERMLAGLPYRASDPELAEARARATRKAAPCNSTLEAGAAHTRR